MTFNHQLLDSLYSYMQEFVTPKRLASFDRVLSERTRYLTVVIDDVHHEQNSSAVVRTAECLGLQDIHIVESTHTHKLSRFIAKGADKWLTPYYYRGTEDNTYTCLRKLKDEGYRLIAATPHINEMQPEEIEMDQKSALIIGGEKAGLSATALRQADLFVKIPIYGFTESYNLSNASAMLLYTLVHKMRNSDAEWHLQPNERQYLKLLWTLKSVRHAEKLVIQFLQSQNIPFGYELLEHLGLKNYKRKKYLV